MIFAPKWRALKVSVITPVLPASSDHLAECEASINELTYALGYQGIILEWLVAVDGPGVMPHLPRADRVVKLPQRVGVANARNAALAMAKGEWVLPLDADDLAEVNGMAAFGQRLIDCPDNLGWFAANRVLLNGDKTAHWNNEPRHLQAGTLAEQWASPFLFHPNSVVVRRSLLNTIGGWPNLPVNEDMAMALLLSEHANGFISTDVITRYRAWEKQAVADDNYPALKTKAFQDIGALINECRTQMGRTKITTPIPGAAYGILPIPA